MKPAIGQLMDLADALSRYEGPVHAFRTMGGVELLFGAKPTPVLAIVAGQSAWKVWRYRADGGVDIDGRAPQGLTFVAAIGWALGRAPAETVRVHILRQAARRIGVRDEDDPSRWVAAGDERIPVEAAEFLIARAVQDDHVLALPVELHVGGVHEGTVELRDVRDELTDAQLRSLFLEGGAVHGETTIRLDG